MASYASKILTRALIPGSPGHSPKDSAPAKLCANPKGLSPGVCSVCSCGQGCACRLGSVSHAEALTNLLRLVPQPGQAEEAGRSWLGTKSWPGRCSGRPGRPLSPQLQGPVPCEGGVCGLADLSHGSLACLCRHNRLGLHEHMPLCTLHVSAMHPTAPTGPAWGCLQNR